MEGVFLSGGEAGFLLVPVTAVPGPPVGPGLCCADEALTTNSENKQQNKL